MLAQDLLNGRGRDARVAGVLDRATADRPGDRYREAGELARALREALGLSASPTRTALDTEDRNPFKGLHAFAEADADDFFGRDALVDGLVARLAESVDGARFLAVVGPSGSGKSSAVRAGLIPTLRAGALPGSESWFYAEMLPGAHPFEELEVALQQVAVSPPAHLLETLERSGEGLAQVLDQILPGDGTELVLVVDQLEEVFTMVEDEQIRDRFLQSLVHAQASPGARIRVIVTLRADFYDRPLSVAGLAELMRTRTATVVPLTPEEIERAIDGPTERVGTTPELALVAEMVADVSERQGALPLLQFALTELFDRRRGTVMTLEAYRQIGGVSGALARRAEELYERLDREGRRAAKQVLLRLVTVGEGIADTRRLVPRAELLSLPIERRAVEGVIDLFGRHRLLAFDRDPTTRGPTVEVAHEALLASWDRLRIWIDDARTDLLQHRRLAAAAAEWDASGRDPGLLPRGRRLEELSSRTASSEIELSQAEKEFVSAGVRQHEEEQAEERSRAERERALERRSVVRLRALVAVMAAATLVAAGLTAVAVNRAGEAQHLRVQATIAGLTASSVANLESDPDLAALLALHAVEYAAARQEPIPSKTVEAVHWAMQEAGIAYPVADAPTAVVSSPFGKRGILNLSISQLANAVRAEVPRDLKTDECATYFSTETCPKLPASFPGDLQAEPVTPVKSPPGENGPPLAGTRVTMLWGEHGDEEFAPFLDELDAFTERTGIEVELVDFPNLENWITTEKAEGDPPDLTAAIPGVMSDLARRGHLVHLEAFLDVDQLTTDQSPYLVSLGTLGADGSWPAERGHLFGAFTQLNVKGLIWYPTPELHRAGYAIPGTWEELVDVTRRLKTAGQTPWCMGLESGPASGWPATDWVENLVLAEAGVEAYDAWTSHEMPFASKPIRRAFERFGDVVFPDGSVPGGPDGASGRFFGDAQRPMLDDQPGCWLHLFPTFASVFLPSGAPGRSTSAFAFPPFGGKASGLIGGGETTGAFSDRPEVRELLRFLISPDHGLEFVKQGLEFMSPNRHFDLTHYDSFDRRNAEALLDALIADTFRFDASDLMPRPISDRVFFDAMMQYLDEGPSSLDGILEELDAAWPDSG